MSSIGKDQLYIVSKLPQFCRLREFLFISFFSILNTYYFSQTFCHFDWAQRLRILDSFCVFSMRRFASYSKWRFSCQFEFIYVSRWPPALPRRSRDRTGIENSAFHLFSMLVAKLPQFFKLREFLFVHFFSILNTHYSILI